MPKWVYIKKKEESMVHREEFLQKLIKWQNENVIKVITGIRRCGKSTLMLQFQDYLKTQKIRSEQIISLNFEELENEELLNYKTLYEYLKSRLVKNEYTYIFLDEIQKVPEFEKVVDSLYVKNNVDIYITGSNAYMLSGDLATYLTGRYVEIKMLPLSFLEFLEITKKDKISGFSDYLKFGGMPYVAQLHNTFEKIDIYIEGIYNTVILKDIEERQKRKENDANKRKIQDIALLNVIAKYLASVIGSPVSIKGITDYLVSNGRKVSQNTVNDYVEALIESFIFYPVERFDIVGKQILKQNKKYYMVDLGLRNHILPRKNYDFGFSIENIVFLELFRRGYKITTGKQSDSEVDFVAKKNATFTYIQVTADMTAQETFDREIRPLKLIKDNYKKMIITMDYNTLGNYDGIQVVHLLDWIVQKK